MSVKPDNKKELEKLRTELSELENDPRRYKPPKIVKFTPGTNNDLSSHSVGGMTYEQKTIEDKINDLKQRIADLE